MDGPRDAARTELFNFFIGPRDAARAHYRCLHDSATRMDGPRDAARAEPFEFFNGPRDAARALRPQGFVASLSSLKN